MATEIPGHLLWLQDWHIQNLNSKFDLRGCWIYNLSLIHSLIHSYVKAWVSIRERWIGVGGDLTGFECLRHTQTQQKQPLPSLLIKLPPPCLRTPNDHGRCLAKQFHPPRDWVLSGFWPNSSVPYQHGLECNYGDKLRRCSDQKTCKIRANFCFQKPAEYGSRLRREKQF